VVEANNNDERRMSIGPEPEQRHLEQARPIDVRDQGERVIEPAKTLLGRTGRKLSNVLMYSHDGFGLGHMRRNANIAAQLVKETTDASALMVVGCSTGHLFDLPKGVDFLRLPSIVKVGTNDWAPRSLNVSSARLRDMRANLIAESAKCFQPEVVLVDHLPAGVWRELVPTLKMLKRQSRPPKIVLGLRDIIDAPELVRETWSREGIYDIIAEYYDQILVYGTQSLYDTASRYGLIARFPERISYCGYVCTEQDGQSREETRAALRIDDTPLVLVTAGGGADAFEMMDCSLGALRIAGAEMDLQAALVAGPLMEGAQLEKLKRQAIGFPIRVLSSVPNFMSYMNAADLVVTMGGYNTLVESIRLGKPTIVVPRPGPSAEQQTRARLFDHLGLVEAVELAALTPDALAGVIRGQLKRPRRPSFSIGINGVAEVVRHLRAALDDKSAPELGTELSVVRAS
jgi:predicted glycosyltransferase